MNNPLVNTVIIIIGAANHIGYNLYDVLKKQSVTIVLFDSDPIKFYKITNKLKINIEKFKVLIIKGSLKSKSDIDNLAYQASELGDISLVINNVSSLENTSYSIGYDVLRDEWETNFWRIIEVQKSFNKYLLKQNNKSYYINITFDMDSKISSNAYAIIKPAVIANSEQFNYTMRELNIAKISTYTLNLKSDYLKLRSLINFDKIPTTIENKSFTSIVEQVLENIKIKNFLIDCTHIELTLPPTLMTWKA
jgi:short-subunit dehydrogenase